jgi:hypothetical protein
MHAAVGHAILNLARESGASSLVVVGTGKNVGKTVVMRCVYEACMRQGMLPGLTSIGRDGEAADIGDAHPKPRLFLREGTIVATARDVLPRSPASLVLELSNLDTAAGTLVYARVQAPSYYELVGPPTASGVREALGVLRGLAPYAIVDGAVDRIAALAGGDDAVVVVGGASGASTLDEAVIQTQALAARLRVERYDGRSPALIVDGALTATRAEALIRARERRAIVVRDPTQIALHGRSALSALSALQIRCLRPLRVVALAVASIGREQYFEPREFARRVAEGSGLPTFDVYTAERAA